MGTDGWHGYIPLDTKAYIYEIFPPRGPRASYMPAALTSQVYVLRRAKCNRYMTTPPRLIGRKRTRAREFPCKDGGTSA